jgi:hypothetical protein
LIAIAFATNTKKKKQKKKTKKNKNHPPKTPQNKTPRGGGGPKKNVRPPTNQPTNQPKDTIAHTSSPDQGIFKYIKKSLFFLFNLHHQPRHSGTLRRA